MNNRSKDRQPSPWDVLTVKEASEIKGVSTTAVYYAINANLLPAEQRGKIWLIRRVDLEHYQPDEKRSLGGKARAAEAEAQTEAASSQAGELGQE